MGFWLRFRRAVLDEIQYVPDLVSYIQTYVDEHQKSGMFVLTGSRQFELMESVSQSLAGRTAVARLLPFSYDELYAGRRGQFQLMICCMRVFIRVFMIGG